MIIYIFLPCISTIQYFPHNIHNHVSHLYILNAFKNYNYTRFKLFLFPDTLQRKRSSSGIAIGTEWIPSAPLSCPLEMTWRRRRSGQIWGMNMVFLSFIRLLLTIHMSWQVSKENVNWKSSVFGWKAKRNFLFLFIE